MIQIRDDFKTQLKAWCFMFIFCIACVSADGGAIRGQGGIPNDEEASEYLGVDSNLVGDFLSIRIWKKLPKHTALIRVRGGLLRPVFCKKITGEFDPIVPIQLSGGTINWIELEPSYPDLPSSISFRVRLDDSLAKRFYLDGKAYIAIDLLVSDDFKNYKRFCVLKRLPNKQSSVKSKAAPKNIKPAKVGQEPVGEGAERQKEKPAQPSPPPPEGAHGR